MSDVAQRRPEPEDLAAEYALGVLDAGAHRAAEARALADPAFAADALAWSERLSPLLDEIAPVAAPPELWPRIAARLDDGAASAGVTDLTTRRTPGQADAGRLARSRNGWRTAAITAAAACLACLAVLAAVLLRPVSPPPALMVAELQAKGDAGPLVATYDPVRSALLVSLPRGVAPAGRSPELWLIDASGKPAALGVVRSGQVSTLTVPAPLAERMKPQVILAVSIEPPGGSPTGAPTGPVVAKGALRAA